jgi:hypothetical protein
VSATDVFSSTGGVVSIAMARGFSTLQPIRATVFLSQPSALAAARNTGGGSLVLTGALAPELALEAPGVGTIHGHRLSTGRELTVVAAG